MFAQPVEQRWPGSRIETKTALSRTWRNSFANVNWTAVFVAPVLLRYWLIEWNISGVVDRVDTSPFKLARGRQGADRPFQKRAGYTFT
jgi:hypothetical protein